MKKIIKEFDCASDKDEFNSENVFINIRAATKLFYLIIIFELLLIVRAVIVNTRPFPDYAVKYICCYSALLLLSLITLVAVRLAENKKNRSVLCIEALTTIYEFGILIWAVAITTLDSYSSERFIVYLTVVVCLVSVLRLRPWVFLLIEIGGYFLLNISMLLYLNRFNASQIINLTVFTIIFVVISISQYNSSIDEYYNKKKIEQLNTLLKSEKETLEIVARTDQLTGLFSRNIMKSDTENRILKNYNSGKATGIAMFDIDNFKQINDTYGHVVGDECLRQLGECFRKHPELTVYRYGGEEFLAVCDGISEAEFVRIIDSIVRGVAEFKLYVDNVIITISAGYVYSVPESETCDEKMIKAADNALYAAKAAGKNRYVKG